MSEQELRRAVKRLLTHQPYGVLATLDDAGRPHTSIVAFVTADDLGSIVFCTPRNTRKCRYLALRPQVSFFCDDRRSGPEALMQVIGVEASGIAHEVDEDTAAVYRQLYLAKYPGMDGFVHAPESLLLRVAVERYDVVDHFQHVTVLRIDPSPQRHTAEHAPPRENAHE